MKRPLLLVCLIMPAVLSGCGGEDEGHTEAEKPVASAWYVSIDGERQGPYDEDQLIGGVRAEEIPPDALAWNASVSDWVPIWIALGQAGLSSKAAKPDAAGEAFIDLCRRVESVPEETFDAVTAFVVEGPEYGLREIQSLLQTQRALLDKARSGAQEAGYLGLNYAEGLDLLVPHLAQSRQLAQLLTCDALVRIEAGDMPAAAADCAAMGRLARQASSDGTIISGLVSLAILHLPADQIMPELDVHALSAQQRDDLQEAFAWYTQEDPFQLVKALRIEKLYVLQDLRQRIASGDLGEAAGLYGADGEALLRLAGEDLQGELQRCRELYDRTTAMAGVSRIPPRDSVDALLVRIDRGEHGPLAAVTVTPCLRAMVMLSKEIPALDAALARVVE